MLASIQTGNTSWKVDFSRPVDISIPLRDGTGNPNCFHAPAASFTPLKAGDFIGSTRAGSPVNFYNVHINPHGNGTHTECVGHISQQMESVNQALKEFHFLAQLITVEPETVGEDQVISLHQIKGLPISSLAKAAVFRTLPNSPDKLERPYSGKNPPYFDPAVLQFLREAGMDPSYLVGAHCPDLGGNAHLGQGSWFVAEIDESKLAAAEPDFH
jgi:hypothetical protein